jgi:sugar/nucleoside kinase (ribokinase family)
VVDVGDPWHPVDVEGRLVGVEWLHVGGLLRCDFPADTIAALARGRRLSLDGQGLVRRGSPGPLRLDADVDPAVLGAAQILTLSEEEADVLGDVDVPEVVVTLGSRGSILRAAGEEHRIEIEPVPNIDPTGAGDAFAVGYLAARSTGSDPISAARSASDLVIELLSGR